MDSRNKYDITGFICDLGLPLEEASKFYAELIHEINIAILELKILINKNDSVSIQKIIHNLKGVSGNYRISDVYSETTKINDTLKIAGYNTLEKDLNHLFHVCTMAIKEIRSYFNERSISI